MSDNPVSARRATPEARCVWWDKNRRDRYEQIEVALRQMGQVTAADHLAADVDAWDAAPADPVVALAPVIAWHGPYAPAWRLLVALGYPDGSPRQEQAP